MAAPPTDEEVVLGWWQSLLEADSNIVTVLGLTAAAAIVVLAVGALLVVRRAGTYTPPVTTAITVLGVALLAGIVALVIRPELGEVGMIAAIAGGFGALGGAVVLAFERQKKMDSPPQPAAATEGDDDGPDGSA